MSHKPECKDYQRVKLTDQQLSDRKAPCPICGQVIRIVPNRRLKEATLSPHGPLGK